MDSDVFEKVQRISARFTAGNYLPTICVTHMLKELGEQDLHLRRRDLLLAVMFQVLKWHVKNIPGILGLSQQMRGNELSIAANFEIGMQQH